MPLDFTIMREEGGMRKKSSSSPFPRGLPNLQMAKFPSVREVGTFTLEGGAASISKSETSPLWEEQIKRAG